MPSVSLELFKKHVNVDFDDDDDYLGHLLATAEEAVVRMTARTRDELESTTANGELPKPLQQAAMLLGGHWYNQREAVAAVSMTECPYTVQALVKPYRRLV